MKRINKNNAWSIFKIINHWHFLVIAIISGYVSLNALRQNNLNAIALRNEVLRVDQINGDTETALRNLRTYVYGHMNTNLSSDNSVYPPIQLKYHYERLYSAEQARIEAINKNSYENAQNYCASILPGNKVNESRVSCIQNYLDTHPNATANPIPDAAYKFDFASPVWSPDLAGWTLLVSIIFFALFVVRFGVELWFRSLVKSRN